MFLSDLSIKRPVFAAVMMLALVTLGFFSYRRLPVDMFPDVEIPVVSVVTTYPGASPETVEREVTKRIEEAVNPISGVKHVMSSSREGVSTVVVQFNLGVTVNDAAQEARSKIGAIRGDLPQAIDEPIIQKLDFGGMPVISLAVSSSTLSPRDLTQLVDKKIKRRFESLSGVGKADIVGESKREVSVTVDPRRLEALGMGINEVIGGLRSENVNTPLGRLKRGGAEYPLRVSGKPEAVEDFGRMVIAERSGTPVTLEDVATVTDGIEERRSLALVNGTPAVALNILKQSGANTVGVVDAVLKTVEKVRAELPPGTKIDVVRDASVMIRDSVEDVKVTLVLGGLLTVFIVFCFLNSWRSTVITGLTLPISVMSSFIIMNFMGMTLNVMTLMALSLAIGLLIDDAIVVRENIVRHLEAGADHFTAAREGTAEIGLAVLATSLTIVAVFVPVAFMKGIIGQFFYHFGLTVAFAVLVSLFVSFTLDPMLSSRWEDPDIERTGKRHLVARILDRFNDWFDRTADRYRGMIGWALDHRKTVVLGALGAFVGGIVAFGTLESSFIPEYDRGEFQVNFKTSPDASIAETENRVEAVLQVLKDFPEIDHTYATIGAGDTGTVRDAGVYVKLVDRAERTRDQFAIQEDVRKRLEAVAGIVPSLQDPGSLDAAKPLQVSVRGEGIELLKEYSAALKKEMYKIPGVVDLEATLEHDIPEYRLTVDRQRAMDAGVRTADIVGTVGALVGGQAASTYEDADGDAVDVRVRLPEELRQDPSQVENLRLSVTKPGQASALVPLGQIVSYDVKATPSEIGRRDLIREVVLSANLQNLPIGTAVKKVKAAAARIPMAPGYQVVFSGEAEDMAESFGYMGEALLLAIVFVYLILAAQFESFIDPLAIMLSLPLSLVGMAGMLRLTGDTISIMSLIGLIMLMGLVTKNAILLVDYAKVLRRSGVDRREAVITAGRTRLRPILMTTAAMIFGMLPLALALGAGAEMRAPMARAVIGGLITSTLLTLLVVPVVYTVLEDFGSWVHRKWAGEAREVGAEEGANRVVALRGWKMRLFCWAAAGLVAVVGAFGAARARAEEAPTTVADSLTLDDCLRLAAEQNRDIQRAREFRNKVQGRYIEERAAAVPQVTVTANGLRSQDQSQKAALGVTPRPSSVATLDAALSQALFTWGKVGAAIRAAKVGMLTADDELRLARQAAARDVTAAFYNVLLARELNFVAREALQQKLQHLDEARKRFAVGVATDYDVLAADVAVKNAQPEVIRTDTLIRLSRDRLRFLLAIDDREVDVKGSLEVSPAPYPTYEEALRTARANRPELSQLRHTIAINDELVKIAQADDKPRVDFRANYGWRYLDVGTDSDSGAEWTAGVYATWPLFDGFRTEGRVVQAKSDVASLKIDERKLLDAISLDVRDAENALRVAGEILTALEGTVAQAQRLLFMANKGFEYGVKTKLDVDDAQLNLSQAQASLASARRDFLVNRVNLEWVMGVLGEGGGAAR
ncbi:MAG: efflux RND transporter permease subunit [Deltaproteobacteria bacterium]|nr:efflux RND transporter permease subunit [Deltaproteobacteria bacterium]